MRLGGVFHFSCRHPRRVARQGREHCVLHGGLFCGVHAGCRTRLVDVLHGHFVVWYSILRFMTALRGLCDMASGTTPLAMPIKKA